MRGQRHAPAGLYPRERLGTHCTGGRVGPRAGLDRDSIPGPSSPYPVPIPNELPGPHCDSTWQQFTILLPCYPATTYNIAVTLPGSCLQYYWPSIRQLFTVILDQYPAYIYNITGLVNVRNWKNETQDRERWKKVVEQARTLYRL